MALHDLDRINEGLARTIDELVPRLYANARRVGNYWELHDLTGAPGDNLKVWRRGTKQGEWCDFAAGRGGRPLGLVIASAYAGNGDAGEGIRWAARFLGQDASESAEDKQKREADAARQREQRALREAADVAGKRRAAQGLFLSAVPIAGTLAEIYLAGAPPIGRAIDLRSLPRQPGALRFHPSLKCPETGRQRPALVAAVAGPGGFMTVHRTFLAALPNGAVGKATLDPVAPMTEPKQTYGATSGGMISIWRGESGNALKDMPQGEWIVAAEGIEDALSIALAAPEMRVVCTIALPFLGAAPFPPQCGGVFWHRHRGDGPSATALLEKQYARLAARGLAVRELWAPDGAKDFNEWLQGQAHAGARASA